MKKCSKCDGPGPFNKSSANPDGLQRWCRGCQSKSFAKSYSADPKKYSAKKDPVKRRAYYKGWRKKHSERLKSQRHQWGIAHAYNLTPEDYETLLEAQGDVCAICKKPETAKFKGVVKKLSVDHDHQTGFVRGLLCTACNSLLGHARDDRAVLEAAIVYLTRHSVKKTGT